MSEFYQWNTEMPERWRERERERERGASLTNSCKYHLSQWRVYIEEEALLKIVARKLAEMNFIKSAEKITRIVKKFSIVFYNKPQIYRSMHYDRLQIKTL